MNKIDQFFAAVMGESGLIFLSSYNDEISFQVRKWFEEHEPNIYRYYLRSLELSDAIVTLNAQLSIQNFYAYLTEHFDEWGYKDGVCKYPEAEKILKEER